MQPQKLLAGPEAPNGVDQVTNGQSTLLVWFLVPAFLTLIVMFTYCMARG